MLQGLLSFFLLCLSVRITVACSYCTVMIFCALNDASAFYCLHVFLCLTVRCIKFMQLNRFRYNSVH